MTADPGKMPEEFIDRPGEPFVQLKVRDLTPEHGEGFIGVGDVAVDVDRECWSCSMRLSSRPAFEMWPPLSSGGLRTPGTRCGWAGFRWSLTSSSSRPPTPRTGSA